jgi:hypothetical protein
MACSNYSGIPPEQFQWEKSSDGIVYAGVTGAVTNSLSLPSVVASDSGYYHLVFTAAGQSVTSSVVRLTINPPLQLMVSQRGANLILSWPQGTLLQATNAMGPWTTNNAESPFTNLPAQSLMFYRVRLQ